MKSKKTYFDSERETIKFNQMLLLVQTIKDKNKRDTAISDVLHSFFNKN